MNTSTYNIMLDLQSPVARDTLYMKRGDTAREVRVTLVEDGKPYEITSRCAAVLCAALPGGADTVSLTIEGNVLTAAIPAEWTASAGEIECEARVYDADRNVVTSPRFSIIVSDTLFPDDVAEVYYGLLETPIVQSIHRPDALASMNHIAVGTEKTYTVSVEAGSTKQVVVAVPVAYKNTVVPTFVCEGVTSTPATSLTNLCDRFGVKQGYKYYTVTNKPTLSTWIVNIPTGGE